MSRSIFDWAWLTVVALAGCGLSVTNERPTFSGLEPEERDAVDTIVQELGSFNAQVEARTTYSIGDVVDREHIHVSFEGFIFNANFGDGIVHVATWENLSSEQRALVQQWFGLTSAEATRDTYRDFFYRFMAVSQGAKQYMYEVLSPAWVFAKRSLFNVERDTIRTALSHFAAAGRRTEVWGLVDRVCRPLIAKYDPVYGKNFNKQYLRDNFQTLAKPQAPTGYMYFICRWYQLGAKDAEGLTIELNWLRDLPKFTGE